MNNYESGNAPKHLQFQVHIAPLQDYACDVFAGRFELFFTIRDVRHGHNATDRGGIVEVKQKDGFAWKCYKKYVACSSGNAHDVFKLFEEYPAYAAATVRKIFFGRDK